MTISSIQMAPRQFLLACQEGIATLPSLLCARGFYFSTKFTSLHSDLEDFNISVEFLHSEYSVLKYFTAQSKLVMILLMPHCYSL